MTFTGRQVYTHPRDPADAPRAVYIRLPREAQRPIVGGCECGYCARGGPATWDTLAIPLDGGTTWTVHWPNLERTGVLMPRKAPAESRT